MRSPPGLRRGLAVAVAAVLAAVACSKTPHFVPDETGGGASTGTHMNGSTGTGDPCTGAVAGTTCPGGVCDDAGSCVECNISTDCGSQACALPSCVEGHCTTTPVDAGAPAPAPAQVPGDCKTIMCDGVGGTTTVPDDADPPPNPDACHTTSCSGGNPVVTPVTVPSSNSPCIADGCDPTTGVYHNPINEGMSCGGCSVCQSGSCNDPCAAMGCACADSGCVCG